MEQWYVAQTQFAQEKRAQLHLQNQGVDCFLPLYTAQVMKNGALKPVTAQALFPGYLFVRFDPEVIHTTTIKGTRGISSLVSFGGLPAPLPDDVVTHLRSHDCLSPTADGPINGDRVEILNGAYEGLEAVWLENDGLKRAMLLLTIMNREVRVPVCGRRAPGALRFRVLGRRPEYERSGKIGGPSMLSKRMPPDNKTAKQQRELSRLKNMLEDWEAGAKPLIDAWRNCLVLAALIPALLAMDGNAWFLLITVVILVIAIAIPQSPPWPECIDRALQNYQPSDAVAFRRLQDAVIVSGEITPDLLKSWLKDELLAVNGPMKKTQYTFTSRTIEDE